MQLKTTVQALICSWEKERERERGSQRALFVFIERERRRVSVFLSSFHLSLFIFRSPEGKKLASLFLFLSLAPCTLSVSLQGARRKTFCAFVCAAARVCLSRRSALCAVTGRESIAFFLSRSTIESISLFLAFPLRYVGTLSTPWSLEPQRSSRLASSLGRRTKIIEEREKERGRVANTMMEVAGKTIARFSFFRPRPLLPFSLSSAAFPLQNQTETKHSSKDL